MEAFATMIGQYNAVALSLTDEDYGHIALDSKSRVLIDHESSSFKLGDGSKFLSLLTAQAAYAGTENGFLGWAVRKDSPTDLAGADGQVAPLQLTNDGRLRVDAEVSVSTGSDKVEDSAHSSGDVGCFNLGIRMVDITADNSALLAGTNGDYQAFFTNSKGEMYVKDTDVATALSDITHDEDAAHSSGDKGVMSLGVANEALADLSSADGDYTPFAVDKKGRQLITGSISVESVGTENDLGVDPASDGEIDVAYHASNFTDIVSIAVGAGETLFIHGFDVGSDVLVAARLVVFDDTTLTEVIRKLPVIENQGWIDPKFLRPVEIAGVADRTVKLQVRCLRKNKTAHVGGGINAHKE